VEVSVPRIKSSFAVIIYYCNDVAMQDGDSHTIVHSQAAEHLSLSTKPLEGRFKSIKKVEDLCNK
jgi:hypothetical protein